MTSNARWIDEFRLDCIILYFSISVFLLLLLYFSILTLWPPFVCDSVSFSRLPRSPPSIWVSSERRQTNKNKLNPENQRFLVLSQAVEKVKPLFIIIRSAWLCYHHYLRWCVFGLTNGSISCLCVPPFSSFFLLLPFGCRQDFLNSRTPQGREKDLHAGIMIVSSPRPEDHLLSASCPPNRNLGLEWMNESGPQR